MLFASGRIALVCVLAVLLSASALGGSGEITMLGTLPGNASSIPVSINSAGDVIGKSGTTQNFIWSAVSGMQQITQVQSLIDVSDINDHGMIAGRVWWPEHDWQAFVWDPIDGQVNLGSLGGIRSQATAVNNAGTVVGKSVNDGTTDRAFRWTSAGGMQDLGSLRGTRGASEASGISNTGAIVGRSDTGLSVHAFRWTETGGMEDLQTLGGSRSIAYAISPNGNAIVGWADNDEGWQRPFRWTAELGMEGLQTLGGPQGLAAAVNDRGAIVGQADAIAAGNRPVLWPAGAANPIDLNDWLAANNPSAAADWHLNYVTDINNAGMVIGYGSYSPAGFPAPLRAFLLDVSGIPGVAVPEPGFAFAIAAGVIAIGLTVRRHPDVRS